MEKYTPSSHIILESLRKMDANGYAKDSWTTVQELLYLLEKESYKWNSVDATRTLRNVMTAFTILALPTLTGEQQHIINERFRQVIFLTDRVTLSPTEAELLKTIGKRSEMTIQQDQTTYSFSAV